MAPHDGVVEWLLEGDPAIRWQVMRDLLDEPTKAWEAERRRAAESGWIEELLEHRRPDGEWPPGRWTASTWTLLLLVALGLPGGHPAGKAPVERLLDRFMPPGEEVDQAFVLKRVDLCHLGFWLGLGAHFLGDDPRLPPLGEAVLSAQFDGWGLELPPAKPPGDTPQLVPYDLQRAREPPNRGCAGGCFRAGVPGG